MGLPLVIISLVNVWVSSCLAWPTFLPTWLDLCTFAQCPHCTLCFFAANNWYPTWPAKEVRPVSSQAAPVPCPAGSVTSPVANGTVQPGWSATWTKDGRRKEKRWVKYDGIGPVDESGMPIASRSVSDPPRKPTEWPVEIPALSCSFPSSVYLQLRISRQVDLGWEPFGSSLEQQSWAGTAVG